MPRKVASGGKRQKVSAGAYKLPDPLPAGEVLIDYCKKEWKLGKPVGVGGFGMIYLSDKNSPGPVSDDAPYALKLEPHANGPLFCELHFYQRVAKPEMIEEWMEKKHLKHLSIPKYITSGSHNHNKTQYRFMVMERCGTDLQKLFEKNGKTFPEKTVYLLGIKLLHALEYIHEKEYVHADIKASNILTGFPKEKSGEVYLVDYGLAFRYTSDGQHKKYKEDPKRVHDGTVEFTSRDAHNGVAPSRRGDLEILGYCMLQWLCKTLPWEDNLNDKNYVRDSKIRYMKNVPELMKKCLPGRTHDELQKYLEYVSKLEYEERPDYNKCLSWFRQALKRFGGSESDKLMISASGSVPAQKAKKKMKRGVGDHLDSPNTDSCLDDDEMNTPKRRIKKSVSRTPRRTPVSQTTSPKKRLDSQGNLIPMPGVPPLQLSKKRHIGDRLDSPNTDSYVGDDETDAPQTKRPVKKTPRQRSVSRTPRGTPTSQTTSPKKRLDSQGNLIPMPGVPPPQLNGCGAKAGKAQSTARKSARKNVIVSAAATQTSPGLKGLPRTSKRQKKH